MSAQNLQKTMSCQQTCHRHFLLRHQNQCQVTALHKTISSWWPHSQDHKTTLRCKLAPLFPSLQPNLRFNSFCVTATSSIILDGCSNCGPLTSPSAVNTQSIDRIITFINWSSLPQSLFTVDDTRGVMMQLECRRLDYAMWCWLLLVPTEQMGRNQRNLQSDHDSLIDLDCEIKRSSIRMELTISEDRINIQPETVSTNNKLFSLKDKKEPHLMFWIKCVRVYLDDKKPE
jgi:hypothetical protein